ncbi:MAG: hypothetical protein ACR2OB_07490 [Solirubrobacteraceae bacterium]
MRASPPPQSHSLTDRLLCLVAAAPLAGRGAAPWTALFAVGASWSATAIVAVTLFTVALHGDRLRSVLVGALTAIAVVVVALRSKARLTSAVS